MAGGYVGESCCALRYWDESWVTCGGPGRPKAANKLFHEITVRGGVDQSSFGVVVSVAGQ